MFYFVIIRNDVYEDLMKWENAIIEYLIVVE